MVQLTHLTGELGILNEAAWATDIINPATTTHYKLGKYVKDVGDFAVEESSHQVNYYDSLNPGEIITTKTDVKTDWIFESVNSWMYFHAMSDKDGAGISEAAGVFTQTPITAIGAQLGSFTSRYDTGNAAENVREHVVGHKVQRLAESINLIDPLQRLQTTLSTIAQRRVDPVSDVSNVPIYPSSISSSYHRDTNMILTWDGDSMRPEVVDFTWNVLNDLDPRPVDGQKYIEALPNGHRLVSWTMNLRRAGGNTKEVWTDYKDQILNNTAKTLRFKLFGTDGSNYKDLTFSSNYINVKKNKVTTLLEGVLPTYRMTGIATTLAIEFKDGLNKTTFYKVAP